MVSILMNMFLILSPVSVLAAVATNVNQVTDLFDRGVDGKDAWMQQLDQTQNSNIESIKNQEYRGLIESENDISQENNRLQNVNVQNIDAAGWQARSSAENRFYDDCEFEIDKSKPGNQKHFDDVSDISRSSGKLVGELAGNVISVLQQQGINCRTVAGSKIKEPTYTIEPERKDISNVVYEQKFCEEPRNKYKCTDSVKLRCANFAEQPSGFEIIGANIPFKHTVNGATSSYEFSNRGNIAGAMMQGGGVAKGVGSMLLGAVGLGINKGSTKTLQASNTNIEFTFNIKIPVSTVSKVQLVQLNYSALMSLRVNGQIVGVYPTGGNKLQLGSFHSEVVKGKRKYGGFAGRRTKHETLYPIVDTGTKQYILGKDSNNNSTASIDLRPFLVEGLNRVNIEVVGLDQALVNFRLHVFERLCLNWQEEWEETCVLVN